jgi:hypothetical protein
MRRFAGFALAMVGIGLACGDGTAPPPPGSQGSFTATVTRLGLSLQGTAVFAVQDQQGQQGFVIALQDGEISSLDVDVVVIARFLAQRPSVGTYTIVSGQCANCDPEDFDGGYVFQRPDGLFGFFASESGTLTITGSSNTRLSGEFSFMVTVVSSSAGVPDSFTVRGSFVAVPGQPPSIG